jgi:class 3 adenylate cyclase
MVTCPHCGHQPPAGSAFCNGCGGKLVIVCSACGATPPPGSRFCNGCGAALATGDPAPAAREERKVISILFADLMGSTALQERLDPESVNRVMDAYYQAVRGPVEAAGGVVVQLLGDGVLCAFGIPRVAEDDALRAVRAAVGIQRAFREFLNAQQWLSVPIGLRVAVNTGEVVVSEDHPAGIGDPLNVAARLQQEARDGEVLIGQATRRVVADKVTLDHAGVFALKGRADTVTAYRVLSLERPSGATTAAFVGRDDELARIAAVYDAAITAPAARLAVVLGSPGLGKSRLIDEVAHRVADAATVITAQCDAAGGATFAPFARAVRAFRRVEDDAGTSVLGALIGSEPDRDRIVSGMGALLEGKPGSPEETFFVIRRFLTALAGSKPVVLVIDDLQWAEPLLLDLVEHLVQWGGGVRLLILVGARPELRDLRSSLVTPGGFVADVITLANLDASAAMRLAASVIGADDLPSSVAARVLATTEGNPLFVGELVRMLVDEGAIERSGERWIVGANLAAFEMPPTIHALLAARIERLGAEERSVLEHAAVVGRHFSRSAVAALLGSNGIALDARLEALRRTELIEPDTGWFLGEPVLRFHHVLIRDAAYRRLLKGTRAALHQRLAEWIEAQVADAPEHDETIGRHLEEAHQHLRELGPIDDVGKSLGERAALRLSAAGRRALAGDDVALAASLLGRALDRLDAADPSRADLALDWCEALLSAGDVGPAAKAIDELARFASESARLRAWHICFTGQLTALTAPQNLQAAAGEVAVAAEELAKLGDAAGEAKAHSVHAQALARLGKVGACEAALDKALAAARKAGDRRRANAVLAGAPVAALGGPSPVTRASGRCLDVVRVLRITQGAPAVEAVALNCQGVLEALRGRTDAARRMVASSRKMVEELGIAHRLFEADVFAGRIDLLEGDSVSAERALRGAYHGLRELGLRIDAARAGALLARAQLAQGRASEAEDLSRESEALAGDDLQASIAWRGVRAEALARRGETSAAVELAQAAVAIASATDALLDHADARLALAAALRAAGRDREADAEERRARELWEAKGATLLAERARDAVQRLAAAESRPSRAVQRRMKPNAASAAIARLEAAFNAGDVDRIEALFGAGAESVDRTNAVTYGRDGALASLRWMLRAREPKARLELLATLGDSLGLSHNYFVTAGNRGRVFDVGDYEREEISISEVDEAGQCVRVEMFAPNRLREAILRLYERHAELLPAGPERERAAAIACSEQADLASGFAARAEDVLGLAPNAFLVRQTFSGTLLATGGAFENPVLALIASGADGRVSRTENWEVGCEAEALARFDELTSPAPDVRRRVKPNAATRHGERLAAAIAARDADALAELWHESLRVEHHPTALTIGRDEMLGSWRQGVFRTDRLEYQQEFLATLGDTLSLHHHVVATDGHDGAELTFGRTEFDEIPLIETDERGRACEIEIFGPNNLGDAIIRLYERHAEQLPEGLARARAAGIARSLGAYNGPIDLEAVEASYDPAFRDIDHRLLGTWNAASGDEMAQHFRLQLELAPDFAARYEDVYALDLDAIVAGMTFFGTARDSGGRFENKICVLIRFGADGRHTETDVFEAEQVGEALARFDEITAPAPPARRRVNANAASERMAGFAASLTARDLEAAWADIHPGYREIDHTTGSEITRDAAITSVERLFRSRDPRYALEPLATLGERLVLLRRRTGSSGETRGRYDVGAYENEAIQLFEFDPGGLCCGSEVFATNRLGDAVVRLYERHAEQLPEGPARARAAEIARTLATWNGPIDLDAVVAATDPVYRNIDHRVLGTWSAGSADEMVRHFRLQLDLAPDFSSRYDDVFALDADAIVATMTFFGTARDSGGWFENKLCLLFRFGASGRSAETEVFEPEQAAEALARLDALAGERPRRRVRANTASRSVEQFTAELSARDEEALAQRFDESLDVVHHPTGLSYGRRQMLTTWKSIVRARRLSFRNEHLASLGESLTLDRHVVWFEGFGESHIADVGPSEVEEITLIQTDARGRWIHVELLAPDRLGDAIARLYERSGGAGAARSFADMQRAFMGDPLANPFAPTLVAVDHRLPGIGTLHGDAAALAAVRAFLDLVRDVHWSVDDVLGLTERHVLIRDINRGVDRASGGAFERVILFLAEFDSDGRIAHLEIFEGDHEPAALARFDELARHD